MGIRVRGRGFESDGAVECTRSADSPQGERRAGSTAELTPDFAGSAFVAGSSKLESRPSYRDGTLEPGSLGPCA
jgi:hypothetical protein